MCRHIFLEKIVSVYLHCTFFVPYKTNILLDVRLCPDLLYYNVSYSVLDSFFYETEGVYKLQCDYILIIYNYI